MKVAIYLEIEYHAFRSRILRDDIENPAQPMFECIVRQMPHEWSFYAILALYQRISFVQDVRL